MHRETRQLLFGSAIGFGAALAAHYALTHDLASTHAGGFGPGVLQRRSPVEDQPGTGGIGIDAEVAESFDLEPGHRPSADH